MISTTNIVRTLHTTAHRRLHSFIRPVLLLVAIFLSGSMEVPAVGSTYRVYLTNKGIVPFVRGSALYNETKNLLSDRCLVRRTKSLPADSLFSLEDAPVYKPYVDDIVKSGADILLQLRWNNYVVVECDSSTALRLAAKPYVRRVTKTGAFFTLLSTTSPPEHERASSVHATFLDTACGAFRYGPSRTQNYMLHSHELHRMGITGSNVLMGVIDNGFRWRAHDCFNGLAVEGEYDFIFRDSTVGNDSLDVPTQDGHGTACLAIAAGFLQDSLIGIAPGASVLLAKTEDMRYERRIEEDRFAAAIEWLESKGVDVTSSSVGYDSFDSTDMNYPFDSLDGRASICARAVNRATSLGVMCVTAAGNSGGVSRTIITPGDADSAFTIGAYRDDSLNVADFTSKGPNARGLLKPDFATLGKDVITANLASRTTIGSGNGTSFATPALAGGIALLLSQFPSLRPYEMRSLLRSVGSNRLSADSSVGYGLPDLMAAAERLGIVVSPPLSYGSSSYQTVAVFIRSSYALRYAYAMIQREGTDEIRVPLQSTTTPHQYFFRIPYATAPATFNVWFDIADSVRTRRVPESGQYVFRDGETSIPCGVAAEDVATDITSDEILVTPMPTAVAFGTPSLVIPSVEHLASISIRDVMGRELVATIPASNTDRVSLQGLPRGMYVLHVRGLASSSVHSFLIY